MRAVADTVPQGGHIGLTYDLRDDYRRLGYAEETIAEFDSVETVEAIERALRRHGFTTERIGHVRELARRLVAGERWDMVFNIAEGLAGRSREAQVPSLLEAFDVPYVFSDPLTQAVTLDKSVAKRIIRDAGVPTPAFCLIESVDDVAGCDLGWPVFVKPVAEGTGKGCSQASRVTSHDELAASAASLIARFGQPALAETYLPGREFTVGIVGNGGAARVVGVLEIALNRRAETDVYSYENKANYIERVIYTLCTDDDAEAMLAGEHALRAYRALGCRDAARLDLRSDGGGVPNFIEANTLAGLNPVDSDLPILAGKAGIAYDDLIGAIVRAAQDRYGHANNRQHGILEVGHGARRLTA